MTYLRDAAVVQGVSAHALDRILARHLPAVLPAMPEWMRVEVLVAQDNIRRAAKAYESLPIAAGGSAETDEAEIDPEWTDDEISTEAAATLLGVSNRRARQLGAAGLGRKVGPVWVFDRARVLAERRHRMEEV
jgi:hypothetical protein